MTNKNKLMCQTTSIIHIENRITGQKFSFDYLKKHLGSIKNNNYYSFVRDPYDTSSPKVNYLGKELKEILQQPIKPQDKDTCINNETTEVENINTYVINLDRAPQRWEHMQNQLKHTNLNYQRFSAIDGYKIIIEDAATGNKFSGQDLKNKVYTIKNNYLYNIICDPNNQENTSFKYFGSNKNARSTTAGEFGIWCSHYLIWKDIVSKNITKALILEDDIKTHHKFNNNFYNFVQNLPINWDMVLVDYGGIMQGPQSPKTKNISQLSYFSIAENYEDWWGAWAYMLSINGAKKFTNHQIFTEQAVDMFMQYQSQENLINGYFSNIDLIGLDQMHTNSDIKDMGRPF